MVNNRLKNIHGITLIALVVTIVVLLILAAGSISMLEGDNGIRENAQDAKGNNEIGTEKEIVQLSATSAMIGGEHGVRGLTKENLEKEIEENGLEKDVDFKVEEEGESLKVTFIKTKREYEVDKDGNVARSYSLKAGERADTDKKYKGVTIPAKFTVSGDPDEDEVEEGLVIYLIQEGTTVDWSDPAAVETARKTYDQFVWVPVETAYVEESAITGNTASSTNAEKYTNLKNYISANNKYPMAIKLSDGSFKGILYGFGTTTVTITPGDYTTSGNREPAILSSYDNSSYYNNSSDNNLKVEESALQTNFNTMVTKVSENGGFWVGRYETSNMSSSNAYDSTQQIKVIKGTTTGIRNVNWYRMYAQQKNYANKVQISRTSSMIWGSQWDQIMIWMKDVDNTTRTTPYPKYIVNPVGMGNFNVSGVDDGFSSTSAPAPTGCFEVKNVYDLARKCF